MARRLVGLLVILLGLAAPAGCGRDIELDEALAVTDVLSGYYDNGVKNTGTQYVPSITFKLKNQTAQQVPGIELDVAFWEEGATGELDSVQIKAIGGDGLAPGASTEALTVRATVGYTFEGARDSFFTNSRFKGFIAKMFAKRSGRIFPLGQFKMDQRFIPHSMSARVP